MDLTTIPGIGPAYRERLHQAGIRDVAALARAPDLSSLSEWSGIASARLASFQAHALRLEDRTPADAPDAASGLVLDAPPATEKLGARIASGVKKAQIRLVALSGALAATLRSTRGKAT